MIEGPLKNLSCKSRTDELQSHPSGLLNLIHPTTDIDRALRPLLAGYGNQRIHSELS